ncbi:UNVERIFIED_CONTAM: hypothetical protein PYX00_011074 [Menopon gallinae]|uniref:Uncharacterized protein n=1 Tax=Menopon gallinae TaxID=328185 RepID=A0AAW2H622_9NEOP
MANTIVNFEEGGRFVVGTKEVGSYPNYLGVIIYSTDKPTDRFNPANDSSFKLHGSIINGDKITLPSGTNYIGLEQLVTHNEKSLQIDGGNSNTTIVDKGVAEENENEVDEASEPNIEDTYYTEDNESNSINHSYELVEDSYKEDNTLGDNIIAENTNYVKNGEFNLNAVLETAKNIGKSEDSSYILEELGSSNISSEVVENMYQIDEANSMAYVIDTVVLASFLLTGAAKAADVYRDEFNTFTVNVKAQAYATHDNYGFVDHGKGKTVAPVELQGTPAHNTRNSVMFGGCPETGFAYTGVFAEESLVVGLSVDGGKDSLRYYPIPGNDKLNFKKDYKASAMLQYNIYDGLKIGAAYNITGFRVSSDTKAETNNDLDRQRAQNIVGGINYNKGRTNMGITGSYQFYRYNVNPSDIMKNQSYGVEAGISYDISGMGVGFRPSVQFDFRKSYNELKKQNKDGSFSTTKENFINVEALELGLSYYVTPNLYYQGAAVLDLRTNKRIAKADGIDTTKNKCTAHHFFGVGVVYKF